MGKIFTIVKSENIKFISLFVLFDLIGVNCLSSNSAALRFIPKENLENERYKKYLSLFE
jgi:hypothetical protein